MDLGRSGLMDRGTKSSDRSQKGLCNELVGKKQEQIAQFSDSLQVLLLHTFSTFIVLITFLSTCFLLKVLICGISGKCARENNKSDLLLSVTQTGCDWDKLLLYEPVSYISPAHLAFRHLVRVEEQAVAVGEAPISLGGILNRTNFRPA